MTELKCTTRGYKTLVEARQCQSQMEANTGRPYAVNVSTGAAMGGFVMYEVKSLPNCFKGLSAFDDLFGNYEKARQCQKQLERMTGLPHVLTHLRSGSLMFSDDYQVTPQSETSIRGITGYFSHFFDLLGVVSL